METYRVDTSANPKVLISAGGELILKGWDEAEVVAKSDSMEDLSLEKQGDEVTIRCQADCSVHVPSDSAVHIENVSGNATIKSLEGELLVNWVSGQLTLKAIGETTVQRLQGNLTARNLSGNLRVEAVDGNAAVRGVQGDFTVEDSIRGNLKVDDVDGNASAVANGNVTLRLDPAPGNSYRFEAHGNLLCQLPSDASVLINIPVANRIRVKFPAAQIPSPVSAPYELQLGDGDARISLSAGGDVIISALPGTWEVEDFEVDFGEDFEGMAESISQQVTQQVEAQMEMLEQQLANLSTMFGTAGLPEEKAERISRRAREAHQRANARAQEKLRKAQEKLQRKLESARRRAEMKARAAERMARDRRRRPGPSQWAPPKPEAPAEPVTDEERLMILEMVAQKKITIEEAEQLLAALEGKRS